MFLFFIWIMIVIINVTKDTTQPQHRYQPKWPTSQKCSYSYILLSVVLGSAPKINNVENPRKTNDNVCRWPKMFLISFVFVYTNIQPNTLYFQIYFVKTLLTLVHRSWGNETWLATIATQLSTTRVNQIFLDKKNPHTFVCGLQ